MLFFAVFIRISVRFCGVRAPLRPIRDRQLISPQNAWTLNNKGDKEKEKNYRRSKKSKRSVPQRI